MTEQESLNDSVCLVIAHNSQIGIHARAKAFLLFFIRFMAPYNHIVGLDCSVEVTSGATSYVCAVRLYHSPQIFNASADVLEIDFVRMQS